MHFSGNSASKGGTTVISAGEPEEIVYLPRCHEQRSATRACMHLQDQALFGGFTPSSPNIHKLHTNQRLLPILTGLCWIGISTSPPVPLTIPGPLKTTRLRPSQSALRAATMFSGEGVGAPRGCASAPRRSPPALTPYA